jgi:hypothetical protein
MRIMAHVQARSERQVGVDPPHQQRAVERVRRLARGSEVRTTMAQIGVQPAIIATELDGQVVCQKGRNEGLESK